MHCEGPGGKVAFVYEADTIPCHKSGLHGYTVRVRPHHPDLQDALIPGLLTWAQSP